MLNFAPNSGPLYIL